MEVIYLISDPSSEGASLNLNLTKDNDQGFSENILSAPPNGPLEETDRLVPATSYFTTDVELGSSILLPILPQPGQSEQEADLTYEAAAVSEEHVPSTKVLQCDICLKKFTRPAYLNLHLRVHTGEKPFSCQECDKCFSDPSSLTRHKRSHTGEKPYKCDTCGKTFSQSGHLRAHVTGIHSKSKPFSCEHCESSFSNVYGLQRHQLIHTGEKPFSCKQCDKSFRSASSLLIHTRVHTGERPHACSECDKTFRDSTSLKNHMRVHTGEKPFLCKVCGAALANRWSLKKHMSARHSSVSDSLSTQNEEQNPSLGRTPAVPVCQPAPSESTAEKVAATRPDLVSSSDKLPYQCELCSKSFANVSNLRRHVRIHNGEKPFICDVCNKTFSQKAHLKTHIKVHVGNLTTACPGAEQGLDEAGPSRKLTKPPDKGEKSFHCSVCGDAFASQNSRRIHERRHTGEKSFQCKYCDQKFSYSNVLKRHVRNHTGEKPYPCEQCDRSFIDSWARKKHMRKHTEEMLYACKVCDKSYSTDDSLKLHLETSHHLRDQPPPITCLLCPKTFDMEWAMALHMKDSHGQEVPVSRHTTGVEVSGSRVVNGSSNPDQFGGVSTSGNLSDIAPSIPSPCTFSGVSVTPDKVNQTPNNFSDISPSPDNFSNIPPMPDKLSHALSNMSNADKFGDILPCPDSLSGISSDKFIHTLIPNPDKFSDISAMPDNLSGISPTHGKISGISPTPDKFISTCISLNPQSWECVVQENSVENCHTNKEADSGSHIHVGHVENGGNDSMDRLNELALTLTLPRVLSQSLLEESKGPPKDTVVESPLTDSFWGDSSNRTILNLDFVNTERPVEAIGGDLQHPSWEDSPS